VYNLLRRDRGQGYLMPPSVREWLPEGDRRGDELPDGLGRRADRLKRLQEAKDRLQGTLKPLRRWPRSDWRGGMRKKRGRKPKVVESIPADDAKANTTDPDSRIMKTRPGVRAGLHRPGGRESGSDHRGHWGDPGG
jgi:hypothetical protein